MYLFLRLLDSSFYSGIGKLYVLKHNQVGSIIDELNELAGFEQDTDLILYEEIKAKMIELMDTENSFAVAEIQDGDIICVQRALTDQE